MDKLSAEMDKASSPSKLIPRTPIVKPVKSARSKNHGSRARKNEKDETYVYTGQLTVGESSINTRSQGVLKVKAALEGRGRGYLVNTEYKDLGDTFNETEVNEVNTGVADGSDLEDELVPVEVNEVNTGVAGVVVEACYELVPVGFFEQVADGEDGLDEVNVAGHVVEACGNDCYGLGPNYLLII